MSEAMEDDLLDDLINIVHNEDEKKRSSASGAHQENSQSGNEYVDDDGENDEGGGGDGDNAASDDENSIDEMLEKPIDILDDNKKDDQVNFYTYDKIQIKHIYWRGCQDTLLPEGWVQVTHACGMPLYLNRATRVCTLSRPYYIGGETSARKHDIPASAIPCMAYQRRKEIVERQIREHHQEMKNNRCPMNYTHSAPPQPSKSSESIQSNSQQSTNSASNSAAAAPLTASKRVTVSITTNEEKARENLLSAAQIHEYCKRLFEFDVVKVRKFKTWNDRKKFMRKSKQRRFPVNSKLLKIQTKTQKGINKELNINMTNKTPLSILYEYSNQVFKSNPKFEIQEKENPKEPFQAVCYINEKVCGKGSGNSKKAAKNSAAEAALCVLIPEFKSQSQSGDAAASNKKNTMEEMYAFFDGYEVESSYVYALSQKLGAPLPYDVLLTCLKYNFAMNMSRNRQKFIEEEIRPIKYRNCLYRMKLAQYDVEVNCTKKKEGRQLAAQKILKQMHPHIATWGSILRLYASRTDEMHTSGGDDKSTSGDAAAGRTAESAASGGGGGDSTANSSTTAAATAAANKNSFKAKPNRELLEKLREEMKKLKKADSSGTNAETHVAMLNTLSTIPPLILSGGVSKSKTDADEPKENEAVQQLKIRSGTSGDDDGMIAVVAVGESNRKEENQTSTRSMKTLATTTTTTTKKRRYSDDQDDDDDDGDDDDESDTSTSEEASRNSGCSESGEESDTESSSSHSSHDKRANNNTNSFSD